jgi:hypothetical protein
MPVRRHVSASCRTVGQSCSSRPRGRVAWSGASRKGAGGRPRARRPASGGSDGGSGCTSAIETAAARSKQEAAAVAADGWVRSQTSRRGAALRESRDSGGWEAVAPGANGIVDWLLVQRCDHEEGRELRLPTPRRELIVPAGRRHVRSAARACPGARAASSRAGGVPARAPAAALGGLGGVVGWRTRRAPHQPARRSGSTSSCLRP